MSLIKKCYHSSSHLPNHKLFLYSEPTLAIIYSKAISSSSQILSPLWNNASIHLEGENQSVNLQIYICNAECRVHNLEPIDVCGEWFGRLCEGEHSMYTRLWWRGYHQGRCNGQISVVIIFQTFIYKGTILFWTRKIPSPCSVKLWLCGIFVEGYVVCGFFFLHIKLICVLQGLYSMWCASISLAKCWWYNSRYAPRLINNQSPILIDIL